jgi:hypothetical protein
MLQMAISSILATCAPLWSVEQPVLCLGVDVDEASVKTNPLFADRQEKGL